MAQDEAANDLEYVCVDSVVGWIDDAGRTCAWYSAAPENCELTGGIAVGTNGLTANQACCACSGGTLEPVPDGLVVCGSSEGLEDCGGQEEAVFKASKHPVRCCSYDRVLGWRKNKHCTVNGGSRINGLCYEATFSEASDLCASQGAKLCTSKEMLNDCTAGTGCEFDNRKVWVSNPDEKGLTVCGSSNKLEDCGGQEAYVTKNSKQTVRCCSTKRRYRRGWQKNRKTKGCTVWSISRIKGQCHEKTFSEASDLCKSVGGRLCTREEMANDCTSGMGCELDKSLNWVSDAGLKRLVVCGSSKHLGFCGAKKEKVFRTSKNPVRCCSDSPLPGFQQHAGCTVWGASEINGQCHTTMTFDEASDLCASVNARLCTRKEMVSDCVEGTGCSFNRRLIWVSDMVKG